MKAYKMSKHSRRAQASISRSTTTSALSVLVWLLLNLAPIRETNAQNLITDPSFELNSPAWGYILPDSGVTGLGYAHTGLACGFVNSGGMMDQEVPTIPGQQYKVDFWLAAYNRFPGNGVGVNFGDDGMGITLGVALTYMEFSFIATPTHPNTEFQFAEWGPGDTYFIDDISVTLIPEPSTFALLGLGAAALMIARRRG